jgi:hypothetical protein
MARIPEYSPRQSGGGGINPSRATGEDFGSGVGKAMQEFGGTVQSVSSKLQDYEDQRAKLEAQTLATRIELERRKSLIENRDSIAKGDSAKYHETYTSENSNLVDSFSKENSSKAASDYLSQALNQSASSLTLSAMEYEYKNFKEGFALAVKKNDTEIQNQVRQDDSFLDRALEKKDEIVNSIRSTVRDPNEAEKYNMDRSMVLHDSAMDGVADRMKANPNTTEAQVDAKLAELRSDDARWKKGMSPAKHAEIDNELMQLKKTLQEKKVVAFQEKIKDWSIVTASSGKDSGSVTLPMINSLPVDAEAKKKLVRVYEETKTKQYFTDQAFNGNFETVKAKIDPFTFRKSIEGKSEHEKAIAYESYNHLVSAASMRDEAFKANNAGFVMSRDGHTEALYDNFKKASNDPNATAFDKQRAAKEYTLALDTTARRLGYSSYNIIPAERLAEIKTRVDSLGKSPEAVDGVVAELQKEAQSWGPLWQRAAGSLKAAKLDDNLVVASLLVDNPLKIGDARDFVKASTLSDKDLATLPDSKKKEIQAQVDKALKPYAEFSSHGGSAGEANVRTYREAITKVLQHRALFPSSFSAKTADDYVQSLVYDHYTPEQGLLIPKDSGIGGVELNYFRQRMVRDIIGGADVVAPLDASGIRQDPKKVEDEYKQLLHNPGGHTLVPWGDKGVRVLDRAGNQVLVHKNGAIKPLAFLWSEVGQKGLEESRINPTIQQSSVEAPVYNMPEVAR